MTIQGEEQYLKRDKPRFEEMVQLNGDCIPLRNAIAKDNLGLVAKCAKLHYRPGCNTFDDLFIAGCIGLFNAMKRFKPALGFCFSTYAIHWINQAIERETRNEATGQLIALPVYIQDSLNHLSRAENLLRTKGFDDPSLDQLSDVATNIVLTSRQKAIATDPNEATRIRKRFSPNGITELQEIRRRVNCVSLDEPCNNGANDASILVDMIADDSATPEDELFSLLKSEKIRESLNKLPQNEREVIIDRYGFDGPAMTLREVADKRRITYERVRQIEERGMKRLIQSIRIEIMQQRRQGVESYWETILSSS